MDDKKMTPDEIEAYLMNFSGSEHLYRHWTKRFVYTDGPKWLADTCGAHWLIDAIASHQPQAMKDRKLAEFQVWELRVNDDRSCSVVCLRDEDDEAFRQEIEWTDFPLKTIRFYLENGTLILPNER